MKWLLLVIIVVLLVLAKRRLDIVARQQANRVPSAPPTIVVTQKLETEEIVAVITAAVAEYEGTDEFRVLSIRQVARNWKLIGRGRQLRGG